ncbi:TraB/GumN family protein [Pseudoduganella chitinolytica]|uniref:TraB/GumN family protein n=1 Tax=Pseudoduganella chitinolytica TaxID=34070 RepID=A0ABY8B7X3_9BURK|nr:TraB/GumN family protein [Pseudoduganella chitinolytica]WEF31900.1 TraB/GumN family protein [Pseudoduganella chitinolytica]
MRRQIIVMFTGLFWLLAGLAPLPVAAQEAAQKSAPVANRGALFRIEHDGHVAWLFGTIHVGARSFYPFEPRLMTALREAGVLALEVDPLGPQDEIARAVREHGMYQNGRGPASAELPAPYRPRLERLLRQYGIGAQTVAPMKPWMIASLLAVREFEKQGYRAELAVDAWLSEQAHARGQKVVELESVASQMALFGRMAPADQARFLRESIDAVEDKEQADDARAILQAWSQADRAALERIAAKTAADTTYSGRFVSEVLLAGRNPALADGIEKLLKQERRSVAAIGVLHLVGTGSVPELLRGRGLRVERIY